MKLFKEISQFVIICYISCVITKIAMNKLTFNYEYLLDSLVITLGATIGWFTFDYFHKKKGSK